MSTSKRKINQTSFVGTEPKISIKSIRSVLTIMRDLNKIDEKTLKDFESYLSLEAFEKEWQEKSTNERFFEDAAEFFTAYNLELNFIDPICGDYLGIYWNTGDNLERICLWNAKMSRYSHIGPKIMGNLKKFYEASKKRAEDWDNIIAEGKGKLTYDSCLQRIMDDEKKVWKAINGY